MSSFYSESLQFTEQVSVYLFLRVLFPTLRSDRGCNVLCLYKRDLDESPFVSKRVGGRGGEKG